MTWEDEGRGASHVDAIKFKVVAKPNPKDVTHPIFINVDLDYDD